MSRGRSIASVVGSLLLILAGVFAWLGFTVTTCTQCNTASLAAGVVYSTPLYLIGLFLFYWGKHSTTSLLIACLPIPLVVVQIYYAAKVTYAVLVLGTCACAAYYDPVFYGSTYETNPDVIVLTSGPILLITGISTIWLLASQIRTRVATRKIKLDT